MTAQRQPKIIASMTLSLCLIACNGNDHDTPKTTSAGAMKTLTVTPSLGKITNARVILRNAATNTVIGEQNTGTSGKVTFNVPASVNAVITEVQGGNGAQYFDEATGQMTALPTGVSLRAGASLVSANSELAITVLTEAALQYAQTLAAGGDIMPFLQTAKQRIEQVFGVTNISQAPTLVANSSQLAALGSSLAERYALVLASLAKVAHQQLGATETAPALKMAQALSLDLQDGDIDGSGNTGTLPYDVTTFASQYQTQVINLVQDFIGSVSETGFDLQKLQALLAYLQNNPLILDTTPVIPPMTLVGLLPMTAKVGDTIKISGVGFAADPTQMKVTFANNVIAQISHATDISLHVIVPQGAVSGTITVSNLQNNTSATQQGFIVSTSGGGVDKVTFGELEYHKVSKPINATYAPDQLVWDGSKFVGLERSRDFHSDTAKLTVWLSSNGIDWTTQTTNLKNQFPAMAAMNNRVFQVASAWQGNVSDLSKGVRIASSADGITWQSTDVSVDGFSTSVLAGGKYLNNRYFLSTDTDCMLMTSSDALTWTAIDLKTIDTSTVSVASPSSYCSLPSYKNGKYLVYRGIVPVGGTFNNPDHYEGAYYQSTDGLSWSFATYSLPAGFNIMAQGGRSFEIADLDGTLVIRSLSKVEYVRDPVLGFLSAVTKEQKLATSQDGVNWTFADATGVTYAATEVGKPAPIGFFGVKTDTGYLTYHQVFSAGVPTPSVTYYTTTDGVSYQTAPNYGLLASGFPTQSYKPIYAYSPTLKRLVVIDGGAQGNTIRIGTLDF
ncbi:hypothetical protein [Agitococcus lubricus]|uniref:IPT/TIG domain-containing protein n=1 Tax=Agitococcus lubricus TaxID=1077255 RepID=A0A2T5IV04_9GAMM|nr:hypothetical protein [Agitococcus lubricus]PTQ87720.1 hypothetical protein C8N29_11744 [Agitococcus lubricus]